MNRSLPALLVAFSFALPFSSPAQTPAAPLPAAPAPVAAPAPAQAPKVANPAPATGVVTTLQAKSRLVVVDVVVTDKNHQPVHGLKASDFQVREAGTAQVVKSVDEHTPATAKAGPTLPPMPAGSYTNFQPVPDDGPLNVLLIDKLNTPTDSQLFLQKQLVEFVKTLKPGTKMAIFGLNRQLIYLQGFSSDPKVLLAALESKKNKTSQTALLDSSKDSSVSQQVADTKMELKNPDDYSEQTLLNVQQFDVLNQSYATQLRVRYTLSAMNVLARYLSALPGRKNLIWFSGSFPLSILPQQNPDRPSDSMPGENPSSTANPLSPFEAVADMQEEYRETAGMLSKAQVAVYPIDARGIQGLRMGITDASQNVIQQARQPSTLGKALTTGSENTTDEHSVMMQMAGDTGGQAYINTNALADAVSKAVENGANYYTIAYTPSEVKNDGSFRRIQVGTMAGSYSLSYRKGYYAEGIPKGRQLLTSSANAPAAPTSQQMEARNSMLRGTPPATEILFKASVAPVGPPTDEAVATNNVPTPEAKGPFRKYLVSYVVSPTDLGFKNVGGGKYEIAEQFVAFVYDSNGVRLDTTGNVVHATVTVENVKAMLQGGMVFHQVVSVPAKGDYYLRLGVHDLQVDHLGSVEIPVEAVKNLAVVEEPKTRATAPTLSDLPK